MKLTAQEHEEVAAMRLGEARDELQVRVMGGSNKKQKKRAPDG